MTISQELRNPSGSNPVRGLRVRREGRFLGCFDQSTARRGHQYGRHPQRLWAIFGGPREVVEQVLSVLRDRRWRSLARLEIVCGATHRGFKSHPLRHSWAAQRRSRAAKTPYGAAGPPVPSTRNGRGRSCPPRCHLVSPFVRNGVTFPGSRSRGRQAGVGDLYRRSARRRRTRPGMQEPSMWR